MNSQRVLMTPHEALHFLEAIASMDLHGLTPESAQGVSTILMWARECLAKCVDHYRVEDYLTAGDLVAEEYERANVS